MQPTIVVDVFEPEIIKLNLSKNLNVVTQNLVGDRLGDYTWLSPHGRHICERKKVGEAMNEIGGQLDAQLRDYIDKQPYQLNLIIEGVATADGQTTRIWKRSKNDRFMIKGRTLYQPKARLMSYLTSLKIYGINVYYTVDEDDTAYLLSTLVMNSQHEEYNALKTYPKPDWHPNPYVQMLLPIKGLGTKRAEALIDKFGTPEKVFKAPISKLKKVEGIGEHTAKLIHESVGRTK